MSESIVILGNEQSRVDESRADAGLPPLRGVRNGCVFRASRDASQITDGRGWTYHHHVDMAVWKGRLYVGWNACERDEDIWPSRELFSTSADGLAWTAPEEMFPQGVSTCLRMYFFHAPNGRMLAIAGLRAGTDKTSEDNKAALVVREIRADHTWGKVYKLQPPAGLSAHPSMYLDSGDKGFTRACELLLADTVFLEQQDRGRLLGDRRMPWHDAAHWPGGQVPGDNPKWVAGKAYTFFERPDGVIVGVSKMGWTTISQDAGRTWLQPAVPSTLVTGKAKAFAHRTSDGRYALVYNPSRRNRFPLAIVTGEDGVHFSDMRLIQGELPIQRYAGADRSIGPQYTRGVSKWADDGTRADDHALWLVYSMSKEDIWVSRVLVPIRADEERSEISGFGDWNWHHPKWSSITTDADGMHLENRDPFDYASVTRLLPPARVFTVELDLVCHQPTGRLEIDLLSRFAGARAIQLAVVDGFIFGQLTSGSRQLAAVREGKIVQLVVYIDSSRGKFRVVIDGRQVLTDEPFCEAADGVHRITLRTGAYRNIGGKNPVPLSTDVPQPPVRYTIAAFKAHAGIAST